MKAPTEDALDDLGVAITNMEYAVGKLGFDVEVGAHVEGCERQWPNPSPDPIPLEVRLCYTLKWIDYLTCLINGGDPKTCCKTYRAAVYNCEPGPEITS